MTAAAGLPALAVDGAARPVSSLSRAELGARLAGPGIHLRIGVFVVHLGSRIASVADGVATLYADYPLLEDAQFADFHIRLVRPRGLRRWYQPQVLMLLDGVTTFLPLPLDQAMPMFEWGLNWAISNNAHSYLIIHAAVVARDGYAAILPAPPGSGKSTLCAALIQRGWRLLSDELALLRLADGMVLPMARPVSLKNASIGVIGAYAPEARFSKSVSDTTKGTVAHLRAPAASVAAQLEPARPAWVIFPKYIAGSAPTLTPMSRGRTFMGLAENAFNFSLLGAKGFDALAGAVEQSAGFQFTYSALDDAIAAFDALRPAVP